jgi:hypothetical protein
VGDFTTVQDGDSVAEIQTASQVVGDHENGPAAL